MSRGSRGKFRVHSLLGGKDRATLQRWVAIWMVLVAVGWFWLLPRWASAQDMKDLSKPGAPRPKLAVEMPTPAEAPQAAPAAPAGDPAGTATGDENTAVDARDRKSVV